MRTEFETQNLQAINDFFDAFGTKTSLEYSTSIIDIIRLIEKNTDMGSEFKEDLILKMQDINRLILQLSKTDTYLPQIPKEFSHN